MDSYKKLQRDGFALKLIIGEVWTVREGNKPSTTISEIQQDISKSQEIHPTRQRIFLGGQLLEPSLTLSHYGIKQNFILHVKTFLSVLVSSMKCPGLMLTELEVDPKHCETVRNLKRKLNLKLGIDINLQRLYLNPEEMTSFPRRLELDDISLLSRYITCSNGRGFIELRPKTIQSQSSKLLVVKIPVLVQNACDSEAFISTYSACNENQPIVFPHMGNEVKENLWLSLEINRAKIIKRDPLVGDIIKLLRDSTKSEEFSDLLKDEKIKLGFGENRIVYGGKILEEDKKSEGHYMIRFNEELVTIKDNDLAQSSEYKPIVTQAMPIQPLSSYDEVGTRYTMPSEHRRLNWNIAASQQLDLGAEPTLIFETSAFSYSRKFGSWDIIEHYKTYVEILVEGTFYVGDIELKQSVIENDNLETESVDETVNRGTFHLQDGMELSVFGPDSPSFQKLKMINTQPMVWYSKNPNKRRTAERRQDLETLDREPNPLFRPSPFRFNTRPTNMPEPTELCNSEISYDRPGYSELVIGQWYLGKERVSDVNYPGLNRGKGSFEASCERGVTIDERPYVTVSYDSRCPAMTTTDQRRAFDFRVQSQFYICTKADEFESGKGIPDIKQFTLKFRQNVRKITRVANCSDVTQHLTSGPLETTLPVRLASWKWWKEYEKTKCQ